MFKLFLLLVLSGIGVSQAEPLLLDHNNTDTYPLNSHVLFNQQSQDIEIKELLSQDLLWQALPSDSLPKLGARHLWLTFSIVNTGYKPAWSLELNNPHLDNVEVFLLKNKQLIKQWRLGDSQVFTERNVNISEFLLPLYLSHNDRYDFYLKLNTEGISNLPITLYSRAHYIEIAQTKNLKSGMQIGILLAIGIFAVFLAIAMRSSTYGYYAGYVLAMSMLVATLRGYSFQYLWPESPLIQHYALLLIIPLVLIFGLTFTEKLLCLKRYDIRLLRALRTAVAVWLLLMLVASVDQSFMTLKLQLIAAIASCSLMIYTAWVLTRRGHTLATLSLIGWTLILLGTLGSSLSYLNIIYFQGGPTSPLLLAMSTEIVLLAGLMAYRFYLQSKATQHAQQLAHEQSDHLQKVRLEALRAEEKRAEELEDMVQQRTLELEIALKELAEANHKLTVQTETDSLTGVRNRQAFDARILAECRISRRQQSQLSLLMIDIDKFKSINDTFGHMAGDETLKTIAIAIQQQLKRPTDLLSRFGGEEFAILLPNTDLSGAQHIAERIRLAVANLQLDRRGQAIALTVSIGISTKVISNDDQAAELLEQADNALYQAKNQGRNRVCLAS
ncbi:MAG: sensor domain-containing diguanylate cyclase [Shewanella sp.]